MNNNIFDKYINKIPNMTLNGKSEISLSRIILIFYLLVGINYTGNLYGNQLQETIKNSRFAQHLIGFILMIALIMEFGNIRKPITALLYSGLAYFLFILTTRLDLNWNLAIIGLLVLAFFYENYMKSEEQRINEDDSLSADEKEQLKNRYKRIKSVIFIIIMIVMSYGLYQYVTRKEVEFGDDFDTIDFLKEGGSKTNYYLRKD